MCSFSVSPPFCVLFNLRFNVVMQCFSQSTNASGHLISCITFFLFFFPLFCSYLWPNAVIWWFLSIVLSQWHFSCFSCYLMLTVVFFTAIVYVCIRFSHCFYLRCSAKCSAKCSSLYVLFLCDLVLNVLVLCVLCLFVHHFVLYLIYDLML